MPAQAQYRIEHVAETPRGYRVASFAPGPRSEHVVRVAFPPGRRRRGSGRLVEILHPASEKNPQCDVSQKAKTNPSELLIFGNPASKKKLAKLTPEEDRAWVKAFEFHVNAGKTDLQADKLAWRDTVREFPRLKKFSGALPNPTLYGSISHGDRVTIVNRFGQERTGRAVMLGPAGWVLNMGGAHGTPAIAGPSNIVRVKKMNPDDRKRFDAMLEAEAKKSGKSYAALSDEGKRKVWRKVWPRWQRQELKALGIGRNPAARDRGVLVERKAARRRVAIKRQLRAKGVRLSGKESLRELRARRRANAKVAPGFEHLREQCRQHFPCRGRGRNPSETSQAVKLFQSFHGKDAKDIVEKHVSAAVRKDYAALGDLDQLKVKTPLGQVAKFAFEGDGVKLASSPDGKTLYAIGGNQNLAHCLDKDSQEKDFIDLGDALEVVYTARKVHGGFEPIEWVHKFGENSGALPRLGYDKLRKQIFFIGGEYFIDTSQGVSPGIEN